MYTNELRIQEINQYYARHGGRRTAGIKGFANYIEHARMRRTSTAKSSVPTNTGTITDAGNSFRTKTNVPFARQTVSKEQSDAPKNDNSAAQNSESDGSCCDKCQLASQLMLRMMTNNVYTQSGLGYPAAGSGALAAYQSLSKYFGTGIFS